MFQTDVAERGGKKKHFMFNNMWHVARMGDGGKHIHWTAEKTWNILG